MSGDLLVVGVGNPGRGDDGIGPALVEALEEERRPGVSLEAAYQLSLEHAAMVAEHRAVLFIDASVEGEEPWSLQPVEADGGGGFVTHTMEPGAVLAACDLGFGAKPAAWLLAVRGYEFGFAEGLSEAAARNLGDALAEARRFIDSALRVRDGGAVGPGAEEAR